MWFDYSFFRICTKSYIYLTCLLPVTLSERLLDLYVYAEVFYQAKWSVIKVSVFSDQFAIQNDFYYWANFKLETVRIRLSDHLSFEKSTNHSESQMTSWFALLYYCKEYTKPLLKRTTDKTLSFSEREKKKISVQFETIAKENTYLWLIHAKMVPGGPQAKVFSDAKVWCPPNTNSHCKVRFSMSNFRLEHVCQY